MLWRSAYRCPGLRPARPILHLTTMTPNKPRISIIIPAYNVEQYIEAALDSVLAQDTPAYEVIVVNDGSTDATAGKIAQYEQIAGWRVVTTKNQGLGPARNEGLHQATGEYVYFFDSDDLLDKRLLSTVTETLNSQGAPDLVLFSGRSFQDSDGSDIPSDDLLRPFAAAGLDGDNAVARLVRAGTPSPCAWLYVSKRSLWQAHRLSFRPIIHEDDEVFLRLVLSADRVSVLEDVLCYRRMRPGSIMSSGLTPKNAQGLLQTTATLTVLYRDAADRPAPTRRAIRKRAIRTAQRYLRVCRKAGVRADTVQMLHSACTVRSLPLATATLGRIVTSKLRAPALSPNQQ